jgi:hypothetical protein
LGKWSGLWQIGHDDPPAFDELEDLGPVCRLQLVNQNRYLLQLE